MRLQLLLVLAATVAQTLPGARLKPSRNDNAANDTITSIPGIRVGHYTLTERPTGCTVVLVDGGAVAGVAQRGAAPGTRETDLLRLANDARRVDGIVLSGGSAFGLDAANGAVRFLDEHGSRSRTTAGHVPIVPSAVLIDLWVGGKPHVRPDAECGYRAAASATTRPVPQGSVGAGAGATLGKLLGRDHAMKGGVGSASALLRNGLRVAAIVAVNPLGDVIDPHTGALIAGARTDDGSLADARRLLRSGAATVLSSPPAENTTIAVVATNARLTAAEATRVAEMADAGYPRAIAPVHTSADGDTVFTLATGGWRGAADVAAIGAIAADVVADAIVRAIREATSTAGVPAARDLPQ
ncbi:MAG TPA: P1 family peptidase [Vicinamibacterales bacterium]|nr:P1 family peptidase [Vicinamibacterales bacterium]